MEPLTIADYITFAKLWHVNLALGLLDSIEIKTATIST